MDDSHRIGRRIASGFLALALGAIPVSLGAFQSPRAPTDRQAALRQFLDARHCLEQEGRIESMAGGNAWCRQFDPAGSDAKRCSPAALADREKRLEAAQARQTSCSADPRALASTYHAALEAATRHDLPDAEICYVEGWIYFDVRDKPTYIEKSRVFIHRAIRRGDWRIVELLSIPVESQGHGGGGMMLNLPIMGTAFTAYRFNRLLEYGARGDYAGIVKVRADNEAHFLRPAQIANANRWAAATYRAWFRHAGTFTRAPVPCRQSTPTE